MRGIGVKTRNLLALATALLWTTAAAAEQLSVQVPWLPGNADAFQTGAPEENHARASTGALPVTVYRPPGAGPFPFVILLHGCGGLRQKAMWTHWVEPWTAVFHANGIGTAVVDSFAPRGVEQVCTSNPGAWAVRRADDAHSVRAWLAEQPYVDAGRIAVMGMSNGGRTVLAAMRADGARSGRFAAGIALYPGCRSDTASTFHAPLLVLIGADDSVTPARYCQEMLRVRRQGTPEIRLVLYPRAPHTFDMKLPDRTVLQMRLGYDADAAADAPTKVVQFLAEYGLASDKGR